MKTHLKQLLRLLFVSTAASIILFGEPQAAEFDLLQRPDTVQSGSGNGMAAQERPDDPVHFARRGQIKMKSGGLASAKGLEPGDRLNVDLFTDRPYRIIVDKRETNQFGSQQIIGHIEGDKYQTFIMTFDEKDFVISLQDLTNDKTYFVSGKTEEGQGEVIEVDDRKKPRRIQ